MLMSASGQAGDKLLKLGEAAVYARVTWVMGLKKESLCSSWVLPHRNDDGVMQELLILMREAKKPQFTVWNFPTCTCWLK